MTDSPNKFAQGPIDVVVKSNGHVVPEISIVEITTTTSINHIPSVRIVINDGNEVDGEFPLSESEYFVPGAEIEISIAYLGKDSYNNQKNEKASIFSGVVVRQCLQINHDVGSQLIIECRDKAYAMTLDRKNRSYLNKKDSEIISSLIKNYSGLKAKVSDTKLSYGEQVQYNCTDWDYMLMRAQANGLLVFVENGELTVAAPSVSGSAILEYTLGENILNFDANIDTRTQVSSSSSENNAQSQIQGKLSFQGNAKVKLGTLIELRGVGKRFEGKVIVSRIEHEIRDGDWITQIDFGLRPEWFSENADDVAPPVGGLMPSIPGMHIGIVTKLEEDPEQQQRIQVSIPVLGDEAEPVWARMSTFYASNGAGSFFIPEIDDEVVLGFMNNNPSQPIILGSMYSSEGALPYSLEDENNIKSLVTRSQLKIEFDEEQQSIMLQTPAGNTAILSDDEMSISFKDQHDNSIVMNADGIKLNSSNEISIKAKGDIKIEAIQTVELSAEQDLSVEANNIKLSANIGLSAKGNASAELSADGKTTIKGAVVEIN